MIDWDAPAKSWLWLPSGVSIVAFVVGVIGCIWTVFDRPWWQLLLTGLFLWGFFHMWACADDSVLAEKARSKP